MKHSPPDLTILGPLRPSQHAWAPLLLLLGAGCSAQAGAEGASRVGGASGGSSTTSAFVTTSGTEFRIGAKRHTFVGANLWQCMNLGMAASPGDRARLVRELDRLGELGVTNVRIMAGSEGPDTEPYRMVPTLMPSLGIYNEAVFAGLDYCLSELSARGMYAVMVLTNFWEWSGGMAQYVSWSDGSKIPYPKGTGSYQSYLNYVQRFYDCSGCQKAYRDHVRVVLERVNTVSGRRYRDEPAIFSWELANEPRLYGPTWIAGMGEFIKGLAPNHMVTVGSEGSRYEDFLETHSSDFIDYGTVHLWAENVRIYNPDDSSAQSLADAKTFLIDGLAENEALARQLNKPLVLEEFGLARDGWTASGKLDPVAGTTHRDEYFRTAFDWVTSNLASGGAMAGDAFWAWGGEARPPSLWAGDPPHEPPGWYSVYDTDTATLAIVRAHATAVATYSH